MIAALVRGSCSYMHGRLATRGLELEHSFHPLEDETLEERSEMELRLNLRRRHVPRLLCVRILLVRKNTQG